MQQTSLHLAGVIGEIDFLDNPGVRQDTIGRIGQSARKNLPEQKPAVHKDGVGQLSGI